METVDTLLTTFGLGIYAVEALDFICVAGKMHATLLIVTSVLLCVFQLLTNHYEQNWKFYCLPSGWGSYGTASEDELLLTKKIFWGVFDSLSQRVRLLSLEHFQVICLTAQCVVFLSRSLFVPF